MQVSQAGCKGRATSVGEAVDVTCTEHNHPQDQASDKAKKLVSSMRKGHYSDYLHAIEYQARLHVFHVLNYLFFQHKKLG